MYAYEFELWSILLTVTLFEVLDSVTTWYKMKVSGESFEEVERNPLAIRLGFRRTAALGFLCTILILVIFLSIPSDALAFFQLSPIGEIVVIVVLLISYDAKFKVVIGNFRVIRKFLKLDHTLRKLMYFSFVVVSITPLLSGLCLVPSTDTILFISGAAELAFAFYAFTSGNAAYSMVPALCHMVVRKEVSDNAEEIIRAARYISIGALLLLMSGITVGIASLALVQPPVLSMVLTMASTASILVTYGAIRLNRYISFIPNKYLETRNLEDYYEKRSSRDVRRSNSS